MLRATCWVVLLPLMGCAAPLPPPRAPGPIDPALLALFRDLPARSTTEAGEAFAARVRATGGGCVRVRLDRASGEVAASFAGCPAARGALVALFDRAPEGGLSVSLAIEDFGRDQGERLDGAASIEVSPEGEARYARPGSWNYEHVAAAARPDGSKPAYAKASSGSGSGSVCRRKDCAVLLPLYVISTVGAALR